MNYLNLTDLDKQKLVGSYSYGKDEKDQLTVQLTNQGQLTIKGPQANLPGLYLNMKRMYFRQLVLYG